MMNKKAIAAFAAGATLLAGFAMATPAFAGDYTNEVYAEALLVKTNAETKAATAQADVKTAQDSATEATKAYQDGLKAYLAANQGKKESDYQKDNTGKGLFEAMTNANATLASKKAELRKANAALRRAEADFSAADLAKRLQDAKDAEDAKAAEDLYEHSQYGQSYHPFLKEDGTLRQENPDGTPKQDDEKAPKKDDKKDDTTTPDQKIKDLGKLNLSDAAKKKLAVHYVYKAKLALDEADNNLAEKKADYAAKRKTLVETMTELAARKAAAEKANQDLTDFLASGENNSAKETALRDALNRAHAHEQRAFDAEQKAEAEFNAARDAAFAAVAAYNKALAEYKDAYNDAVRLGVNPAALPPVVTSDPLAADFPAVPGTKQIYADALNGKFGPAAQASAKKTEAAKAQAAAPAAAGAAAGKAAAAKGELAKGGNGKGKAGEKLGNAGVGVALTALAASMLAGMGAAVRKMRH
ncbi:hypothetical protein [Gardnerella vaginalis]|uniref:hypothetical protein n=1 Tax=Gardnerella vaginalis TaxID=2702 RepID=UPI000943BF32|nr:hypothetical protein [Gardnerella vaginalis]AYZ21426.1 hypothetical protein EGX90_02410 [Gardnerella vaginalis]OKY55207.1 hypothetical protein BHS10_01092 [Gardnerella vaginalis]PNL25555.1 hypothetical protein CEP75_002395 [Gardnerella vaginalis]